MHFLVQNMSSNRIPLQLAFDAEPRNCYVNDGGLQPFDVVLCQPNDALEKFLRIYPD